MFERCTGRLPDFIIIGAQKGGTSSLQHHLRKHPQIEMAPNLLDNPNEEPHFFNRHFDRGLDWYRSLFNDNGKLQGEKTPNYLPSHECHLRLRSVVPDCKLIAILREPVDRAESAFNHASQAARALGQPDAWGWNTQISFDQNLRECLAGKRTDSFVSWGCYIDQLESLLRHFPREQLLVLISEEYRAAPTATLQEVFRFIGAADATVPFTARVHVRQRDIRIDERTRSWLHEYYRPYNRRLFEFLGREVPQWC